MINLRQAELETLTLLINKKTITLKDLANRLNVSDKTARAILNNVKNVFDRDVANITSKKGSGYTLEIYDEEKFKELVKDYKEDSLLNPSGPKERIEYILDELLRYQEIDMEDLASDLAIGERQLRNDLVKVEEYLNKYNLEIENNKGSLKIVGQESNIRLCFASVSEANINTLRKTVDEVTSYYLNKYEIKISDLSYDNLITHISISILRIKNNNYISYPLSNDIKSDAVEFKVANEIANILSSKFRIVYSLYEIQYIAMHIMGKEIIDKNSNFTIGNHIDELVSEIFELIKTTFNVDFTKNFDLRLALCLHFEPMIKRLKYNLNLENPLLDQIKDKYSYAYTIAQTSASVIFKHFGKTLSDDEIGYIALSFQLALEDDKRHNIDKKNILLICNLGRVSANLMKHRFKEDYSDYIENIDTCGTNDLDNININKYDVAFTVVPIEKKLPIPIIEIQFFTSKEENQEIKEFLSTSTNNKFNEYFNESCFMVSNLNNKEKIIKRLCESIKKTYDIKDDLYYSVLEREEMAPTDFAYKTAMPHTSHLISDKSHVAIMILDKPIIWTTKKVQLIFLVTVGKDKEDSKNFYSLISKFLLNKKCVERLIKNKDYKEFISMMQQIGEK